MKPIFYFRWAFSLLLLGVSLIISAQQIPQTSAFSATVRDAQNVPIANSELFIKLKFKGAAENELIEYCSIHQVTTSQNGFFSLNLNRDEFANGCDGASTSIFEDIDWSQAKFVELEYSSSGSNFISFGSIEIGSSFFAFEAKNAENLRGFDLNDAEDGEVITYDQSSDSWVPGVAVSATDPDSLNELQMLSVSELGDTLFLSKGNWVIIPGLSAANAELPVNSAVDADGNVYPTVAIGDQEWMAENLRAQTFENGDPVNIVFGSTSWEQLNNSETPATSFVSDNPLYDELFGRLYNWYAVEDERNLCPTGYHTPSVQEFQDLFDFVGGNAVAGGKLKSTNLTWDLPNTGATDEFGFGALAAGFRFPIVQPVFQFRMQFQEGHYWTKDENVLYSDRGDAVTFDYQQEQVTIGFPEKGYGYSVRCLKNE
jgi:uncharacterized protein (TIGR02145 family)